jgi:hypothetical protein
VLRQFGIRIVGRSQRLTLNAQNLAYAVTMPSERCSRRISAHSSIMITSVLWPRGGKIQPRDQYSAAVDRPQ